LKGTRENRDRAIFAGIEGRCRNCDTWPHDSSLQALHLQEVKTNTSGQIEAARLQRQYERGLTFARHPHTPLLSFPRKYESESMDPIEIPHAVSAYLRRETQLPRKLLVVETNLNKDSDNGVEADARYLMLRAIADEVEARNLDAYEIRWSVSQP
jgi:hypothetical protein